MCAPSFLVCAHLTRALMHSLGGTLVTTPQLVWYLSLMKRKHYEFPLSFVTATHGQRHRFVIKPPSSMQLFVIFIAPTKAFFEEIHEYMITQQLTPCNHLS